jgi:hypothetical protein
MTTRGNLASALTWPLGKVDLVRPKGQGWCGSLQISEVCASRAQNIFGAEFFFEVFILSLHCPNVCNVLLVILVFYLMF